MPRRLEGAGWWQLTQVSSWKDRWQSRALGTHLCTNAGPPGPLWSGSHTGACLLPWGGGAQPPAGTSVPPPRLPGWTHTPVDQRGQEPMAVSALQALAGTLLCLQTVPRAVTSSPWPWPRPHGPEPRTRQPTRRPVSVTPLVSPPSAGDRGPDQGQAGRRGGVALSVESGAQRFFLWAPATPLTQSTWAPRVGQDPQACCQMFVCL